MQNRHEIHAAVHRWWVQHNEAPDDRLRAVNARCADELGLPTLASLYLLAQRAEGCQGRMVSGAEWLAELAPVLQVATGEARERLRAFTGDQTLEIPGLAAFAQHVLERGAG